MDGNCIIASPAKSVVARVQSLATPLRRIALKSIPDVRREMAKVYRDVRCGRMESSEGTRLIYMLGQISKLISEIEGGQQGSDKAADDFFRDIRERIASRTRTT